MDRQKLRIIIIVGAAGVILSPCPLVAYAHPVADTNTSTYYFPVDTSITFTRDLTNCNNRPLSYDSIVDIVDSNGYSSYVNIASGTIQPYANGSLTVDWYPDTVGNYTMYKFVVSNLTDPELLAPVTITNLVVLENMPQTQNVQASSPANILTPPASGPSLDQLKEYALQKINQDRAKFGLPPVKLSSNMAAQAHADDLLKSRYYATHWTTDGMKPYMRYTVYKGTGYVAQNVYTDSIFTSTDNLASCANDSDVGMQKINPFNDVVTGESEMMYNDSECCQNGHRDNILDKYHTDVSIGIAYDDYYFAMVQNFENNYIQYNSPITTDNKTIQFFGTKTFPSADIYGVDIYYDPLPTPAVYYKDRDMSYYDEGNYTASVYPYTQITNSSMLLATRWDSSDLIDVSFDLTPAMTRSGVYTVYLYFQDKDGNPFPVTSYSVFYKR